MAAVRERAKRLHRRREHGIRSAAIADVVELVDTQDLKS